MDLHSLQIDKKINIGLNVGFRRSYGLNFHIKGINIINTIFNEPFYFFQNKNRLVDLSGHKELGLSLIR